jgi:putative redox protein
MTGERVGFAGGLGHHLVGQLELPDGAPVAHAVFAPCFTCPKDAKAIVRISRALAARGIAVLRYDVTGIGHSEGEFTATTFTSQVDDLVAAAAFLRRHHRAPTLALGISLGGAVVIAGARQIPEAKAVATVNAPADTVHLRELLLRLAPEIMTDGEAEVTLVGARIRIGRPLVEDLARHDILGATADLGLPLMVFHAPEDTVVSVNNAHRLLDAAHHPKSLIALDGSDHLLLQRPDAATMIADIVAAWTRQYLQRSNV